MSLSDEALQDLFLAPESERLERKRNESDTDKIRQTICAFANDLNNSRQAGVVIIGQSDDLSCANIQLTDNLLTMIGGWRSDGKFQPIPSMSVERRTVEGCSVAVISVRPAENTPIKYDGRIWIRTGPRLGLASPEDERILNEKRRYASSIPFDAKGIIEADLSDINLVRFNLEYLPSAFSPDVLARNGRSDGDKLSVLRLIDGESHPTVAAVLLLGKLPQAFFPGAYIQVLKIDGERLTDPYIDRHELTGTLPDQIRRVDELMDLWIKTASLVGGVKRIDRSEYPLDALRQIIRNSILHRSYEGTNAPVKLYWFKDRIEFHSPGGPYGSVTAENFGMPNVTDYRNPTLAEGLKALGFVEKFGFGLQSAKASLAQNGNPPMEFDVQHNNVLVLVRSAA